MMQIELTPYTLPLVDQDSVKVRSTPNDNVPVDMRNKRGKVIGQMHIVTVQFDDGTVQDFNRDELSFKGRGDYQI